MSTTTRRCPDCGMVTHNIHDVQNGYCGACREFTPKNQPFSGALWDDMRLKMRAQRQAEEMKKQQEALQAEYYDIKQELRKKLDYLEKVELMKKIQPDESLMLMFCRKCEQLQHANPTGVCSECSVPPLVIQEEPG